MAKDARAVANYLLDAARNKGKTLTPMQLLKLVYIAHGWCLAWFDRPLIGDDVEAWQYGPVVRSVYDAFKKYGREPVERPTYGEYDLVIDIGLVSPDDDVLRPKPIDARFSPQEKEAMDAVFDAYGDLSGIDLSRLTHQPDSPWDQVFKNCGRNAVIDNDKIKKHFKTLDRRNQELLAG